MATSHVSVAPCHVSNLRNEYVPCIRLAPMSHVTKPYVTCRILKGKKYFGKANIIKRKTTWSLTCSISSSCDWPPLSIGAPQLVFPLYLGAQQVEMNRGQNAWFRVWEFPLDGEVAKNNTSWNSPRFGRCSLSGADL